MTNADFLTEIYILVIDFIYWNGVIIRPFLILEYLTVP